VSDDRARRLAQLQQLREQGILDEDTYRIACAALEAGTGAKATNIGSGAIAQAGGTAAGEYGVAVAGSVYGNIYTGPYQGPPPKNRAEALFIYRRVVAQATGQLPLRGVDVGASDPTASQEPLGLANVYVSLDTTTQVELTKTENKEPTGEAAAFGGRETRPLGALEAAIAQRHLVLLGDPGGGKSTFLHHLAYCLAMQGVEPDRKWLEHLPGWPERETPSLPIVVILRDFARQWPKKLPHAEPRHLWSFMVSWLKAQNMNFAAEPIKEALEKGTAFVMLDGLDEVPTVAQRQFVRDAVTVFVDRYPRSRFLVTCRVLSYQPPAVLDAPDLRLPQFSAFELAHFDEEKIDRFITGWYNELARLGVVRTEDQEGLAWQLKGAVRRPDLWRLAPNPLLLTVMALVHTHKGRLPDARSLLYEETIDILLWRWEQVKAGGQKEVPRLRALLLEANRTEVDLKRVLWQLAYEAHAQGGGDPEKLADIGELKLQKALAALKGGDRNWAGQVIEAMKLRAGLLLERAPEMFTFPHRTFQEYLAGAHLASQAQFARDGCKLAERGALWREALLMAVGRLVYLSGDTDKPLALVGELCPARAHDDDASWRKAWLAGDVLLEMGTHRVADGALGRDLLERVRTRLVALIAGGKLSPRERAMAGTTLGRLGDPRFRADAWYLPEEPLLGFVEIPEGSFRMGTAAEDIPSLVERLGGERAWYEREVPQHEVRLPTYYISRYPVTVAQFRAFIEASGYEPHDEDSLRGVPNHPIVWVSWYDALAYCDWLTETLKGWERTPEPIATLLRQQSWRVTLPSEAEWERAARGEDGRTFPWGDEPDPNRANYGASGVNATSAVGCFPGGASPSGCHDMSGNVWEWTRSLWGKDWENPTHRYPYDLADDRENLKAPTSIRRVLRGGAFGNYPWDVHCAYRDHYNPDFRDLVIGFRVVVSPFFPGR
jgi:formylglycine-generating enzyme required for sulfatase activity